MDLDLMRFAEFIVEKVRQSGYGVGLTESTIVKRSNNEIKIKLINYTTDLELTIRSKDFGPVHR